jgi:cell division control protein 24
MNSAAGRKKSLIATPGSSIDAPVATNTALNKAASQSTSLYQQCSSLRTRLMRVQDFSDFFNMSVESEPSSSRRSTDVVSQLWDCFVLGVPLCYLFNLLPHVQPIDINIANFDPTNDRTRKRAIALFAMNVQQLEGCGTFTVTDLWDRGSTDGFVKVCLSSLALCGFLTLPHKGRQYCDSSGRSASGGGPCRSRTFLPALVVSKGLF